MSDDPLRDFDDFEKNLDDDTFGDLEDEGFGSFDEFDDDASLEDGFTFDDEGVEIFEGETAGEDGGSNRTFIVIAAVLVIVLLGSLGVLAYILVGPGLGPSDLELTATRIVQLNATTFADATNTAEAFNVFATETQIALSFTPTASITPSEEPSATPDRTATAEAEMVVAVGGQAQSAPETQTAIAEFNATPTAESEAPTAIPTIGISEVQMTATALAGVLGETEATPTPEVVIAATTAPEVSPGGGAEAAQLPETGLFDDLGQRGSAGVFVGIAFGLLGVIIISRRLRRSVD